ncbi:iron-containing alcohol dehydrogenase family protein [Lacticaseibacillus nasuensis]|uniref:Alcohol dehydrogenase, iron-containing n=1 Tax=Lacticaseibacillus nasuensis JCM 17158 TaxID=1291734 RepID=A0A0R1K0Q5_9LACO|nr:iron-containing alcohol dehydrogenase family protein [Lacticaseibacillus nasuensis]KRK72951.1 alcohol dehydrogenase, iron-containing [Lacticaseibacillus nasuensis JCM 17158]
MVSQLHVKIGPQFYSYSAGAIDLIPELLPQHGAKRVLVIHGTKSWAKAQPYLAALFEAPDLTVTTEAYHGECSFAEGERLAAIVRERQADFILGAGGGKLCDLTLYTAHLTGLPFGLVPTLASNCAPWTPLAVMYKDNGLAEGKTVHIRRQAAFVLMDPALILDSPVNYFIAGIADTLAKWYESELILEEPENRTEPMISMARHAALMCKDQLLKEAPTAVADMRAGQATPAFRHITEIVVAIAGTVGGFGDKYARNTLAHAIHDALSAYVPELHRFLHGEKVAYGIFLQLACEQRWSTIDALIPFYQQFHLPMSLTQMGVWPLAPATLTQVCELANSFSKVHLLPFPVSAASIQAAMETLERYISHNRLVQPVSTAKM